jgi:hypothetical protein
MLAVNPADRPLILRTVFASLDNPDFVLIPEADRWAISGYCRQVPEWEASGLPGLTG